MIDYLIIVPIFLSFFISLFFMPLWIRKAKQIGLMWKDMNKFHNLEVAGSGGIIVVIAGVISILFFVAYNTFYLKNTSHFIEIFAILTSILFLMIIGIVDDLLGWQKGGLSPRSRLILVLLASIPLVVINAGKSVVELPFLGSVELGLLYPLVLIPIGILGTATTFNFLAGFNGLEAGLGAIVLSALGAVALFTGSTWLAMISFIMVGALIGFLFFNFYPARVFPGDCVTYPIGGLIGIISIIGNFEKIALFFYIPFIIEVALKSRGKLMKYSFGKPNEDGSLSLRYDKLYSLNHAAIYLMNKVGIRATEKRVVYCVWIFQIAVILLGFLIFREGIFA